ncbi:MAG: endonuclease/exonuclease/phosphatase family protein [Opitutaceae bacterium]|nr:endonuclease/exonuclease/phosphatase family protein [Opitutaceae bacterium]
MRRFIGFLILGLVGLLPVSARPFIVLVYNVENLFDADSKAMFEDYQPARYSRAHVLTKLENVARTVALFENGRGPDIILLQEIEVDLTSGNAPPDYADILRRYAGMTIGEMLGDKFNDEIADLPSEALLAKAMADRGLTGYHIVAAENIRAPGSSNALGQKCVVFTRFPVLHAASHPTLDARAIQEVQVDVDGAKLYLFNNHWKSGAGNAKTEPVRVANARTLRARLDEILREDPQADIIVAGDFNSQYNQKVRYKQMKETGLNDVLGSQGNELAIRGKQRDLYNLWFELPPEERGSDTYQGEWGTLMQMIITRGLYDFRGVQYVDNSFAVARVPGLNLDDKGMPIRWSFDGPRGRGFSDHLPIFAKFITVPDNRTDRYIPLNNPSEDTGLASVNKVDFSKVDLEKIAFQPDRLPVGATLRDEALLGRIVRVEGTVGRGSRLTVSLRNDIYDIWSFDKELREKLRADYKADQPIRFYGELSQYKGRWQFIIRDASWVR